MPKQALRLTIGLVACVVVVLVSTGLANAQTAELKGRVFDEQGATLVGATVTLIGTGVEPLVSSTNGEGVFRLKGIAAGRYVLVVELSGFRTENRPDVVAIVGGTTTVDVQLTLAPFAQRVDVVAVAPLLGGGVSRSKIPTMVSLMAGPELTDRRAASLADALHERLGAVTIEGLTTNPLQPTLRFRGFTASPVLGLPQGIAVYQNGVRINEPFGDTVQFDLIPQFAVDQVQLSQGAEPTFGLNALGGALAIQLKNGFDHTGFQGEMLGGSFDRFSGTAEYGARQGAWGLYVGATRFDEVGWRTNSPSEVTQLVTDVAYRSGRIDAGVSFTYADSSLNGNGPAPVELLAVDRSAVFTSPDTTTNRLAFSQGRFDFELSPTWSVQLNGYYRDLDRQTLNGDETDFDVCDADVLPVGAPGTTLCFEAGGPAGQDDPLVDVRTGRFISVAESAGTGAFNRTTTRAEGYGGAVQATANRAIGGHLNVLTLGTSIDFADIAFGANSEIGMLTLDRTVVGSGLFAGIFGRAPDDRFNVELDTDNRTVGVYVSNTLSATDRLHLTASGRFNQARLDIIDRLGTSLDGAHTFSRFNASGGAVFEMTDRTSVFGRYAESSRSPTAAELSCADPDEPCRVPNAFVSDPPLEQAVARSVEGGVRGHVRSGGRASVEWSTTIYRTVIADDILFVASPDLIGGGFFQNAGKTRRLGMDLDVTGRVDRVGWFLGYGLLQATFESVLGLPSDPEVNDAASEEGVIAVMPGDRLSGIPRHSLKAGVRWDVTERWDVAVDGIATSNRVFVGDEGNDQPPLAGYAVVYLRSAYQISDNLDVFVRVDNLFDAEYETSGVLGDLEVFISEVPDANDPRFVGPGAPRSAFGVLRVTF